MIKTFLVLSGMALLALPSLHAQDRNGRSQAASVRSQMLGGGRAVRSGPSAMRPSQMSPAVRSQWSPSSVRSRLLSDRAVRSPSSRNFPRYSDGRSHRYRGGGRYYYLAGVPYFYPSFGFGFGYPSYYYNNFGYYGGYYDEPYPPDYYVGPADQPYEGRIVEETAPGGKPALKGARSLPAAVQRQLAEQGYYKGSIDGEFGPASKSALRRFQRDRDLKETGLIDEATLKALGFSTR